jgi:hypothetical protein
VAGHRLARGCDHADYAPDPSQGKAWAERAFGRGTTGGTNLSESQGISATVALPERPHGEATDDPGAIS